MRDVLHMQTHPAYIICSRSGSNFGYEKELSESIDERYLLSVIYPKELIKVQRIKYPSEGLRTERVYERVFENNIRKKSI